MGEEGAKAIAALVKGNATLTSIDLTCARFVAIRSAVIDLFVSLCSIFSQRSCSDG